MWHHQKKDTKKITTQNGWTTRDLTAHFGVLLVCDFKKKNNNNNRQIKIKGPLPKQPLDLLDACAWVGDDA